MSSESQAPAPAESSSESVTTTPEAARPNEPEATAPEVVSPEAAAVDSAAPPKDPPAEPVADAESGADKPSERIRIGTQRADEGGQTGALKPKPVNPVKEGDTSQQENTQYPPPNVRAQLSDEQEAEFQALISESSAEAVMDSVAAPKELAADTKLTGTVLRVTGDSVIVDLGENRQGLVPLKQFEVKPSKDLPAAAVVVNPDTPAEAEAATPNEAPTADASAADPPTADAPAAESIAAEQPNPNAPAEGSSLEVVVLSLNQEEGIYDLKLPRAAVNVGNWDEVEVGQTVEVSITGHNKGGLECKVAGIRAFMPMGQISLYRVENAEDYVGQKLSAVITEANRGKKNLILSHRAMMEREKAAGREKLLAELAPGQVREGVVRSLRDFGAFVDLGGVDGLIHVSKLSWDRVTHPKDVLAEGQQIKVKIEKIDAETGKIGLSYREAAANPWETVEQDFPIGTTAKGKVSKMMDFGAFVRLKAGVEGLIHISELDYKRVHRVSDVLSEGEEVEIKILSVDRGKQRIALSLKALKTPPPKPDKGKGIEYAEEPEQRQPRKEFKGLKGGISTPSGGDKFGLKW